MAFGRYIKCLETAVVEAAAARHGSGAAAVKLLDRPPSAEARRHLGLGGQRAAGAFFTPSPLATRVARRLNGTLEEQSRILDPACGAGDLLIACSELLPATDSFQETIALWGHLLAGCDLVEPFVRAARLRLMLAATQRGGRSADPLRHLPSLGSIKTQSGVENSDLVRSATHIVLNPPYAANTAPAECMWGSGLVSSAAIFVDHITRMAQAGTRVIALLPDVLRSGARYEKWRAHIAKAVRVNGVEIADRFARDADIHTFILDVTVGARIAKRSRRCTWVRPHVAKTTLSSVATVGVGAVVPHRDPEAGPEYAFVVAKHLPAWAEVRRIERRRQFAGSVARPPVVVVRRTSRPEDAHRAIATIILGRRPVAVENHLLVVTPHDGSVATCRKIASILRRSETTRWLNARIRCRHLTVGALSELPWGST